MCPTNQLVYGGRTFEHLESFVKVLKALVDLGCPAPCNLDALGKFAATDLLAPTLPALPEFAGDVGER